MNRNNIQRERWTDHDDVIRAVLSNQPGAASDACLEPEDLLELAEQGGKHPRADELLRHVLDCANCKNEFQEMRRTVALAAKARELQQPTALEPSPDYWRRLLGWWRTPPAWAAAAAVFLLAFLIIRRPPSDDLPPNLVSNIAQEIASGNVAITVPSFPAESTRGAGGLDIVSPNRTIVPAGAVTLNWSESPSVALYTVHLRDETGKTIQDSNLEGVTLTVKASVLQPGMTYQWIVAGHVLGRPDILSQAAWFRVASNDIAEEIERVRTVHGADRLFMGVFLAQQGLLDAAEADLREVPSSDPSSGKARKLLESIRVQRRR